MITFDRKDQSCEKCSVGLAWDANQYVGKVSIDMDLVVFAKSEHGKCAVDGFLYSYLQSSLYNGAIIHQGDNRDGSDDKYDEMVSLDLTKVPDFITEISVAAVIYDGGNTLHCTSNASKEAKVKEVFARRQQTFGQAKCFADLIIGDSVQASVKLAKDSPKSCASLAFQFHRSLNNWVYTPCNNIIYSNFHEMCLQFGLNIKQDAELEERLRRISNG